MATGEMQHQLPNMATGMVLLMLLLAGWALPATRPPAELPAHAPTVRCAQSASRPSGHEGAHVRCNVRGRAADVEDEMPHAFEEPRTPFPTSCGARAAPPWVKPEVLWTPVLPC